LTASSWLTIAACTRPSRASEFQVASSMPPAITSGIRIRPMIAIGPTRPPERTRSSFGIVILP